MHKNKILKFIKFEAMYQELKYIEKQTNDKFKLWVHIIFNEKCKQILKPVLFFFLLISTGFKRKLKFLNISSIIVYER